MKVAILGDIHFGVRNDSIPFLDNMEEFFSKVFFPEIKKRNINQVICTGDVFHNRRKIDVFTSHRAKRMFFDPLQELGATLDTVAGNHDLYERETSDHTAFEEFLKEYPNCQIFKEPVLMPKYGNVCFLPWINKQNRTMTEEFIQRYSGKGYIAFGHLELVGYAMYRGNKAIHGDDPLKFNGFKHVYTGHYHHASTEGNISYIGSLSQHTWADEGDVRGFYIFDTVTHEMEFIANPFNIFLAYKMSPDVPKEDIAGRYVRVYYDAQTDDKKIQIYEKAVRKIALSVDTIPTKSSLIQLSGVLEESADGADTEMMDTIGIIKSLVDDPNMAARLINLHDRVYEVR